MSTAVYLPVTIGRGAGFHSAPFQNSAWPDADMRAGIPADRIAATQIRSNSSKIASPKHSGDGPNGQQCKTY